ncbi:uncharacterized protein LOC142236422 [Haematobia irritans]|uniref:uncharacterized protein LOC142236422 n=1 Tax=Haematobia irritans TaxID=7368 RepID=UPI003F5059B6
MWPPMFTIESIRKIVDIKISNMEELSEHSSSVIEFKANHSEEKQLKLIHKNTATDPLPSKIDASSSTGETNNQETQTNVFTAGVIEAVVDERHLAIWLQRILPNVEKELLKGCTPDFSGGNAYKANNDPEILPYQRISLEALENSQGIAIWLSVQTNNAPVLLISTISPHDDDWCEHVDQKLYLFVPKREQNSYVVWRETKRVPIKACLRSLCTNPFNKCMFAGSTMDGDIYLWRYEQNIKSTEIIEMYHGSLLHGYAIAIDWTNEQTFLTAHDSGHVVQWRLGTELIKEAEFHIKLPSNVPMEITCLLVLSVNDFVVGGNDGSLLHCSTVMKRQVEISHMKRHQFTTSSLLKANFNGHPMVISCDLSGQVHIHDLRNINEEVECTVVAQIPLPYTNVITCTQDGYILYSPGEEGSLECYRMVDGGHYISKGDLRGKGNFIKSSDNGCWIIIGLYENEFQIFSLTSD